MRAAIRKLGNSSGVIIPKSMLTEIAPIKRRPREGWADAFDQVEELGDEDRAWLEFGNQGDDELTW